MFKTSHPLVALSLLVAACGSEDEAPPPSPPERIAALQGDATNGQALYELHCKICHAADRQGDAATGGSSLVDNLPAQSDVESIQVIYHGSEEDPLMIPFGETGALSDQEIADVYAYIKQTFEP